MMDGSTDSSNNEVELVLFVFCVKNEGAHEIQTRCWYLVLVEPARARAFELSRRIFA